MAKDGVRDEIATRKTEVERVEFRAQHGVHIAAAGNVALSNWVGRVGDKQVRVYRGAPAAKIPEAVQKAMKASGVLIGVVTLEELGLQPRGQGAQILSVE